MDTMVDIPLDEDFTMAGADRTAPSGPASWLINPAGVTHELGAAFGLLSGAGNYSRYGPWGGMDSLTPRQDSGQFIFGGLQEGDQVRLWDRVGLAWVTFTARAVPLATTDFALSPSPHTALAAAIRATTLASQYVGHPGLTLSGDLMLEVRSAEPVTQEDPAYIATLNPAAVRLFRVVPYPGGAGLLMGGAGITQSSLLAGGDVTLDDYGNHLPRLGMVAQGGSALPAGAEVKLTFTPA